MPDIAANSLSIAFGNFKHGYTIASEGIYAIYRGGAWSFGEVRTSALVVSGNQVAGARASAVADPAGGTTIDTQARATLAILLTSLREHGLIAN